MKAIVTYPDDPHPRLVWDDVPDVEAGRGEVLVNVRASAVNRADLSQARGNYPPPPGVTEVLGLEMAGEIAAIGQGVTDWVVGERVCALLPGGGYAAQVAVPAGMLMRLPDDWTFTQGAAIPEVWLTAYVNLFIEGQLLSGERALIHAGGSGVGTAAIQLVRAVGATAYATAGAEFKLEKCRELGAALAVNYKQMDWLPAIMAATNGEGVDVILDPVGANYLHRDLQALRENGRLVHIGLLSGRQAELDLGLVMGKSLRLIGSRLRPRPVAEKIAITTQFQERFWPLLANGTLQPIIDRVFPITDAGAAHEYVRQDQNLGKVILEISPRTS